MSATQTHETWEPDLLAAGYRLCLFDGLSRFYVAEERAELAPALSYPACPQDGYVRREEAELRRRLEETRATLDAHAEEKETLRRGLLSWRRLAMVEWAGGAGGGVSDLAEARHHVAVVDRELEAMRATLSWRVTAPLRGVRRLSRRSAG